jgi:hypothetical protein
MWSNFWSKFQMAPQFWSHRTIQTENLVPCSIKYMGLKFQSHVQFILEFWSYIVLYRCSTENLFPIVYGTRILVTCSITSNLVPCSIDWNFDPMYNWELGLKIQSHEHGSWFVIFGPIYVIVHEIKNLIQFWIFLPWQIGTKI